MSLNLNSIRTLTQLQRLHHSFKREKYYTNLNKIGPNSNDEWFLISIFLEFDEKSKNEMQSKQFVDAHDTL